MAYSVIEELIIYLCNQEALGFMEVCDDSDIMIGEDSEEWVFDLFGDKDIITFLYSDYILEPEHPYHVTHWNEQQFYTE
ncbi:MAG: hypothetical protein LUE96_04345 [Lachnospiraceae bacterium]|nr:hypothetical protein [Lachnospiraceae bacterium]